MGRRLLGCWRRKWERKNTNSVRRELGETRSSRAVEKSSHYWSLAAKLDLVKIAELVANKLENFL